jgi:hypothetical protein
MNGQVVAILTLVLLWAHRNNQTGSWSTSHGLYSFSVGNHKQNVCYNCTLQLTALISHYHKLYFVVSFTKFRTQNRAHINYTLISAMFMVFDRFAR